MFSSWLADGTAQVRKASRTSGASPADSLARFLVSEKNFVSRQSAPKCFLKGLPGCLHVLRDFHVVFK